MFPVGVLLLYLKNTPAAFMCMLHFTAVDCLRLSSSLLLYMLLAGLIHGNVLYPVRSFVCSVAQISKQATFL